MVLVSPIGWQLALLARELLLVLKECILSPPRNHLAVQIPAKKQRDTIAPLQMPVEVETHGNVL